jgi:hypothetical protein
MEFISIREFNSSPAKTPEAIKLLDTIQMQAARSGLASMTMEEIDTEITAYRKEKKAINRCSSYWTPM